MSLILMPHVWKQKTQIFLQMNIACTHISLAWGKDQKQTLKQSKKKVKASTIFSTFTLAQDLNVMKNAN
jgi:L-2-hydroxyglutarate oxidase LhgO